MARIGRLGWWFLLPWSLVAAQLGCMGMGDDAMMNNNTEPDAARCLGGEIRFQPVSPGEGDLVKATLVVAGQQTLLSVTWSVTGPGGPVSFQTRDESRAVEFTPVVAGDYRVEADMETDLGACSATGTVVVHSAQATSAMYRFVFTPSDPGSFPRQERIVTVYEDTPVTGETFVMDEGTEVNLSVEGTSGDLSSYIRLDPRSGGLLLIEGVSDAGSPLSVRLDSSSAYDVSLVPDSPAVAPKRFEALSTVELAGADPYVFHLDSGRAVVGDVFDALGQSLVNADVAMACGDHPAALSSTDLSGHFALAVRPGACIVSVRPDPRTGLPSVATQIGEGPNLPQTGQLVVTVRYADVARGSMDLQVIYPDGEPAAGANVFLESDDASDVASVESRVDGVVQDNWAVAGHWQTVSVTDSQGLLSVSSLPAGRISVLVEPSDREFSGRFELDVPASDATSVILALAEPVEVQGRVFDSEEPGRDMSAVSVEASVREGTGALISGRCASDGTFSLQVPRGMKFDLTIKPDRATGLVQTMFTDLRLQRSGTVPGADDGIALGRGLAVTGKVEGVNVGGTLIQVFCASCENPEPLDEAVVDNTGAFSVLVPNPKSAR